MRGAGRARGLGQGSASTGERDQREPACDEAESAEGRHRAEATRTVEGEGVERSAEEQDAQSEAGRGPADLRARGACVEGEGEQRHGVEQVIVDRRRPDIEPIGGKAGFEAVGTEGAENDAECTEEGGGLDPHRNRIRDGSGRRSNPRVALGGGRGLGSAEEIRVGEEADLLVRAADLVTQRGQRVARDPIAQARVPLGQPDEGRA